MVKFKIFRWQDIDNLARRLFHLVKDDAFKPEIILGISRGGWIPARLLSDMFEAEIPLKKTERTSILATMQITFYTGIAETHTRPIVSQDVSVEVFQKNILLVDDLADTGESLECALEYLSLKNPQMVKVATLLCKPWSKVIPDYYVEESTEWVVFPHEYYEFMTERTVAEGYNKTQAWKTFTSLGIPDSSVNFFVGNFLS